MVSVGVSKSTRLSGSVQTVSLPNHDGCKTTVRKYLRKYGLKEERCRDCGLTNEWNGKPLILQLEHISGDSTDDRLENLCWLCPNCHSQTETYTGKANRGRSKTKIFQLQPPRPREEREKASESDVPNRVIEKRLTWEQLSAKRRAHWPSREQLQVKVWEVPLSVIAAEYGRSLTAVRKMATGLGVETPPIGYWARRARGWTHEEALQPWPKGQKNMPKFSDEQIVVIRQRLANGERPASLAREYACGHKTIRDIRDRKKYRHVSDSPRSKASGCNPDMRGCISLHRTPFSTKELL
jgi:hypothetical protein